MATIVFIDIADPPVVPARWVTAGGVACWRSSARASAEIEVFGGREVNTRGDDFLLEFGSPDRRSCARRRSVSVQQVLTLDVRAGVHLGEVEQLGDDLVGSPCTSVHASPSWLSPGDVLVSQTVRDAIIGSGSSSSTGGIDELKGVPGEWRVFAVDS